MMSFADHINLPIVHNRSGKAVLMVNYGDTYLYDFSDHKKIVSLIEVR